MSDNDNQPPPAPVAPKKFLTNQGDNTLSKRLEKILPQTHDFDCLVGYFFISGFFRLYPALEPVKNIRILIGLMNEQVIHGLIQIAKDSPEENPPSTAEVKNTFGGMLRKELVEAQDTQNVVDHTTAPGLVSDIRRLIVEAKAGLAATVNSALTLLYWRIGQRIRIEVLKGERASYGEQIVATLAKQLEAEHGRGFSPKNLRHMLRFAEVFEAEEIVYALSRQLSWTHLRGLIYIDDPLKREFYLEMCRSEGWSTRTLQGRLDSMLSNNGKTPGYAGVAVEV